MNNQSRTRTDSTNGSASRAGAIQAVQTTLEIDVTAPSARKRRSKRHKTPSQYRRDKKRLIDFKAMKRLQKAHPSVCEPEASAATSLQYGLNGANVTDKADTSTEAIGILPDVPHHLSLTRKTTMDSEHSNITIPPPDNASIDLLEFDPFRPTPQAKVTAAEPSTELLELGLMEAEAMQKPMLAPSSPISENVQMGI